MLLHFLRKFAVFMQRMHKRNALIFRKEKFPAERF